MRERLRVLRHPDFRNLWLAQTTSAMGDGVVVVALALFVTDLTDDPTQVGIVIGAQLVPLVSFLLIGGVWADRLPRARLIMTADIARAALHLTLAVLIFTDAVEIWQMVVIEACFGTAQAFAEPAYTGLVPRTVPAGEIQEAQALSGLTFNFAELTGPAIATVLVLGVGAGWAFLLDAVTFAASALLLSRVRASARPTSRRPRASAGPCSPSSARASARSARARGCGSRSPCSRWPCRSATRLCSCSGRRWRRRTTNPPRSSGWSRRRTAPAPSRAP